MEHGRQYIIETDARTCPIVIYVHKLVTSEIHCISTLNVHLFLISM